MCSWRGYGETPSPQKSVPWSADGWYLVISNILWGKDFAGCHYFFFSLSPLTPPPSCWVIVSVYRFLMQCLLEGYPELQHIHERRDEKWKELASIPEETFCPRYNTIVSYFSPFLVSLRCEVEPSCVWKIFPFYWAIPEGRAMEVYFLLE